MISGERKLEEELLSKLRGLKYEHCRTLRPSVFDFACG